MEQVLTLEDQPAKKARSDPSTRVTLKSAASELKDIPCPKRRKILSKQTPMTQKEIWEKIFQKINSLTPRVGKKIIKDSEVISWLTEVWPEKDPQFIVVCRGTDRSLGPNQVCQKGEAPFRRSAFIHRATGNIMTEDNWEFWENLSQRQIIRSSHPSKLNMTVFARNPCETSNESQCPEVGRPSDMSQPSSITSQEDRVVQQSPQASEMPAASEVVQIDMNSDHHAPKFKALPREEQSLLLRAHKNLGHPSPERLMQLLRQQGFRSECILAVPDMRCSACCMSSSPKLSRPSTIKDQLDFNDKIAIDHLKWTNSQGTSFQIMHLIDIGTSYHAACIAPNRSSSQTILNVIQTWFQWAGAPQSMLYDAGTEFNSDEFMNFLQSNNIKGTSIAPEAHWQNGKSERHGHIIENMLDRLDRESPIQSYSELSKVLWFVMQAKNASTLRRGFALEVLVFGKHTKIPGSISSDESLPAHCLADSENANGIQFREQLALRERARKWEADNDASLRRAILRRSRPQRREYLTGEWVMIWKNQPIPGQWLGPTRVVTQENEHTLWVTMSGRLYRVAPENVREVSALESHRHSLNKSSSMDSVIQGIVPGQQRGTTQFRDLMIPEELPGTPNGDGVGHNQQPDPTAHPEQSVPLSGASSDQPDQEPESVSNPDQPAGNQNSEPIADGIEIPVPNESDNDELITVGYFCSDVVPDEKPIITENQCWTFEVTVCEDDIQQWKSEVDSHEMAFLASNAKRQRAEVRMGDLTQAEKRQFDEAKRAEVQNWLKTGTVIKILRNQLSPQEILRCRWILTWKPIDPADQKTSKDPSKKAKARLVVLGYLDPCIDSIPGDSPTLGRHSKMLVLQTIASMAWTVKSFDVKAAFVQGSVAGRTIGVEPVPELSQAMGLAPNEVCKLNKSAYGLIDAPYLWYQALTKELRVLGFEQSPFDPCVFTLRKPGCKQLSGILGIHVDDGLCGGDEFFDEQIHALSQKYTFGSQKSSHFVFTGIEVCQRADKGIVLSQSKYVRDITPIPIEVNRKSNADEKINEKERHHLRALIGSLQYAAVNTRPDLSSQLSQLQSAVNSATVGTLIQANKTLHEAKKHHEVAIQIQPISPEDVRFLAFSDASFASRKVPDSHAGMIILATHKDILSNVSSPISPISWSSKKIQKVVTSTLSAETMALDSTLDQMSWIRLFWAWLRDSSVNWKKPHESLQNLPAAIASPTAKLQSMPEATLPEAIAATDCKSLFDLVTKTAPPNCAEFRTQLHARSIKDLLDENITLRWVHSGAQLADALTKVMESSFLRSTIQGGVYRLNDELEILKQRSDGRNRIKWLRNCNAEPDGPKVPS